MVKNDTNSVLRLLPLVMGSLGGSLLLVNRLLTTDLTESQSRSDVLGVILAALLVLTGLLWQRVQPRSPESVILQGNEGFELAKDLPQSLANELAWASRLLLTNTATRTLLVWYDQRVLLRRGVLGSTATVKLGPILNRVLTKKMPTYLVDLKLYPGRIEFDYLPENTQGVICQPVGDRGVLILGANAPRSYSQQDESWVTAIAEKLAYSLEGIDLESIQ
ncbi:MAG: cofactor assembly of complex C subunit B [Synechococcales bacterium]|nr:cofactor assembly of complex C subunit B [Cyanobacteria bacterium REEB444]MEB3124824.1 cofactor assembly of complex C subunit B [Synechococcales bacterium]